MTTFERQHDCLLCETEDADESRVVFRDEHWAAEVVSGYEVPGWVILRARRHAERITGLNRQELDTVGHRTRELVSAVSEVMGTPTTYQLVFGENYPHFHLLVVPRGDDVPSDRRAGEILRLRTERLDPAAAVQLVPALRAACQRAGDRPPQRQ